MKKAKKMLSFALVLVLTIVATVGITVAYLTDTDEAENTFALGNVEIELVEQQRAEGADGNKTTTLEDFENDKVLLPIVGSAQGDKDKLGLPTAANWVDKIVDVTNTGSQDAYVRVLMAFPADMDDKDSAADMMLHWNYNPEGYSWKVADENTQVTIEERNYNIYSFTYNKVLAKDATTDSHAITGVYIDSRVDATSAVDENGNKYITYSMVNSKGKTISSIKYRVDKNGNIEGPQIYVFAQAIQSAGFATPADAFAASNFTLDPWNN